MLARDKADVQPMDDARDAARRLFELYGKSVYQFLRFSLGDASEAEDILQDVFLDVLSAWPRYDGRSGEKAWLWGIARHRLVGAYRRRRLHRTLPMTQDPAVIVGPADITDRLELEEAMARLSVAQRQVVTLRSIQDLSVAETATLLGWSQAKVRVTFHRALRRLARVLDLEEGGDRR